MTKAAKIEARLALDTLRSLMQGDGQASVKLAAAREVLDRAFGKPKPAKPAKARPAKPVKDGGLTVIVKRFSDVTPEEEAAAEATERGEL
ncbi:MAG: hypothetical protein ACJ798_14980 [Phenylobacterium sp.]